MHDAPLDYFVISKTKLDNSFPNAHLTLMNYEIRARGVETNTGVV